MWELELEDVEAVVGLKLGQAAGALETLAAFVRRDKVHMGVEPGPSVMWCDR